MEAIIFSKFFEPPEEFMDFCKSIGYGENECSADYIPYNFELMFDARVINFCKEKLTNLWGECVYKGRERLDYKIGFAGAGYIREIDTTKTWIILYSSVDGPIINYVDVCKNKYGHLTIVDQ